MSNQVFDQKKFAAFIITRDRLKYLEHTIQELQSQTVPPALILIVDNSEKSHTKDQYAENQPACIQYLHTGYNAGPAGGAHIGLKKLFEQGFEWVMWVDDDDPPKFKDMTAFLVNIIESNQHVRLGMVGAVGERFNRSAAKTVRFKDSELKGYLSVDTISGNMFPLVSRKVYEEGLLPDKDLFFGYEDLDFGLSLKRNNWDIMVSGELHLRHRILAGRIGLKKIVYQRKKTTSLWREYYSTRSLMKILIYRERNFLAAIRYFFKTIIKSVYVFGYGLSYGTTNFWYLWLGMIHGIFNKKGQYIQPVPKKNG